jgi:catechol 2,3-dioxygenase-like lactoylglutathione lyase family enzyme
MNMKLELVIIPVSDVDRAKAFYEKPGFRRAHGVFARANSSNSRSR